jgi:18S rRNA (guanine1575-N7)-methyltransferase
MSRRPELETPAQIYYSDDNAHKYHVSSRVQDIQRRMTERALELLALPAGESCLLLDLGAGTGIAGEVLQAAGHTWIGTDISEPMLRIAKQREFEAANRDDDSEDDGDSDDDGAGEDDDEDEQEGTADEEAQGHNVAARGRRNKKPLQYDPDELEGPEPVEVIHHDMGTVLPFRPGTFDGAISISALQWLCNIDRRGQVPQKRLRDLFQSLHNSLRRGARAVFQFYPANPHQTAMISTIATKCGFGGGVIIDYPHSTRSRKYFLVIYAGMAPNGYKPPRPLGEEEEEVAAGSDEEGEEGELGEGYFEDGQGPDGQHIRTFKRQKRPGGHRPNGPHRREGDHSARPKAGTKAWVLLKKEQRRKHDKDTRTDSKYTARKRPDRF